MKLIHPREQGFTLTELMIALVLSLMLTMMFIHAILILKNIYKKQDALARIQENARSIHYIIGDAIAKSGNIGCNRMSDEIGVRIHEAVNAQYLGLNTFRGVTPQSGALWLKYIQKSYPLLEASTAEKGRFVIQGKPKWKKNAVILIADCRQADIVSLSEDSQRMDSNKSFIVFKYNPRQNNTYQYPRLARVAKLHSVLFYIAKTSRMNQMNQPIYALYSKDLNGKTQERVEGVEDMRLEYGIVRNATLEYYPSHNLPDNHPIRAIRASFLLSSIESVKPDNGERLQQWWTWEWNVPYA